MGDWNFYEERYRMCKSFDKCADGCPAFDGFCTIENEFLTDKGIEKVKEWSVTHPRKTRQSVFLEQWPNVNMNAGVVNIAPCYLDRSKYQKTECASADCNKCRREFWMQEAD